MKNFIFLKKFTKRKDGIGKIIEKESHGQQRRFLLPFRRYSMTQCRQLVKWTACKTDYHWSIAPSSAMSKLMTKCKSKKVGGIIEIFEVRIEIIYEAFFSVKKNFSHGYIYSILYTASISPLH